MFIKTIANQRPLSESKLMSFLARFFKPTPPETTEQKIAKIEKLPQEQLLSTALNTSEQEQLRLTALGRLDYGPDLLKIATQDGFTKPMFNTARKRIGELLDNSSITLEQLSSEVHDEITLISLCSYSSTTGASLIERISEQGPLLDIAENGSTTQVRQAAAEKVSERDALTHLYKAAKSKDKSVLKIVKRKLDVFKQEDAELAEIEAKIDAACKQAEQLCKRDVDEIFHARKKQIETSWSELASLAKNEAKERFQGALSSCQQKLDAIKKQKEEQQEQEQADREAKKDVHSALKTTEAFIADMYVHDDPSVLESEFSEIESRQRSALSEAENRGLNTSKEHKRAEQLASSARSLIEKLQTSGPVIKLIGKLSETKDESGKVISRQIESLLAYAKNLSEVPQPEIVVHSKQVIKEWNAEFRQQAEKSKEKIRETSELIRKANWAVSKGYVGKARAIFADLEDKVQQLEHVPSHIENKFTDVKESMSKLGDWHEFAVTPKKEALVEKMQSLVDSTLHPQDLANKIHQLQDNWKELCRGGQNQDENLWENFHSASQTAYERCKVYFDEQTKIRDANAELRVTLISQLQEYEKQYDWDQANWKEVEETLKVARETWQSYWPVPRKQIKELQHNFDGILDRIFALRNTEFDNNKVKKQSIVDQSGKLSESDDVQAAIDQAKKLQSQWQTIGRCKRKDDQVLWKAFRANCDAIFDKRNQENEAANEERKAAKKEAEGVIHQLEDILNASSDDFFEAKSQSGDLSKAFQGIGELPRDSVKSLNARYHEVLESIDKRVNIERRASTDKQWLAVFSLAEKLRCYELACIQNEDSTELKSAVDEGFTQLKKWPNNSSLSALQNRFDIAESLDASTTPASNELLRILCVRSEIITNNDTPEEEKAYRMTYQVNQLKSNFGQTNNTEDGTRTELLSEWVNTPAAANEQYPALLKRFSKCWQLPIE